MIIIDLLKAAFDIFWKSPNFEIKQVDWLEGYLGTVSYQLKTAAARLPVEPAAYGGGIIGLLAGICTAILKPIFFLLAITYSHFDIVNKYTNSGYPKNYAVIAMKKANNA